MKTLPLCVLLVVFAVGCNGGDTEPGGTSPSTTTTPADSGSGTPKVNEPDAPLKRIAVVDVTYYFLPG